MPKPFEPHFNGATYVPGRDWRRLTTQLERVFLVMRDGQWRTLREIADITEDPEASVSARLRDLRKKRFGEHTVEREYIAAGLFKFRLIVTPQQKDLF